MFSEMPPLFSIVTGAQPIQYKTKRGRELRTRAFVQRCQ